MTGSGDRFVDWTHVRVIGANHDAGEPYVLEGRKLLDYVFKEAERNGLGVHALRKVMPDGTVIVAEKHGTIPRITIAPRVGGGDTRTNRVRGFVCKPASPAYPFGFNPDKPEAAIVSSGDEGQWATLYDDTRDPPWESVPPPKSTYRRIGGLPAFPDGLKHYGNVDWVGRREERVSWLGSDLRYFITSFNPLSKNVFRAGKVLVDMADTAWSYNVRGACIRGNNLLVVVGSTFTFTSNTPATYYLVRVPLVPAPPEDGLANLVSVPGSAELLWSGVHGSRPDSWFFNASGTVATFCSGRASNYRERDLVTLSIEQDQLTGVWSASSQVEFIGGVMRVDVVSGSFVDNVNIGYKEKYGGQTGVTGPIDNGPHGSEVRTYAGAAGTDVLIARDFIGDDPVDVTISTTGSVIPAFARSFNYTYDYYDPLTEELVFPAAAGYGATLLERTVSKHSVLRMGDMEVVLWDMDYSLAVGTFGGNGDEGEVIPTQKTTAEMTALALEAYNGLVPQLPVRRNVMNVAILVGCDARFKTAMYYDVVHQQIPAKRVIEDSVGAEQTPSPTSYHRPLSADFTIQRGNAKEVITPISGVASPFNTWVFDDPSKVYFNYVPDLVDGNPFASGAPEFSAQHVASDCFSVGHALATDGYTEDATHVVASFYTWLTANPAWTPAKGITLYGTSWWCSMACLTGTEILYGGADPVTRGESVSWASQFDPWVRTGISGTQRHVHPVWVLPTTSVEIRI